VVAHYSVDGFLSKEEEEEEEEEEYGDDDDDDHHEKEEHRKNERGRRKKMNNVRYRQIFLKLPTNLLIGNYRRIFRSIITDELFSR